MSKVLVVANWKMNPPSFQEAKGLFDATRKAVEKYPSSVIVAPPSIYLRELHARYKGRSIRFCAQDVSYDARGAHTGEISLPQAKEAGIVYAIVGHSERRARGETNEDTRKKVAAALAARVTPILCVGEAKRDASGEHLEFIKEALRIGFADVPTAKISSIIVAYEPIWAIGGEEAMKPRDMHEMAIFIRKTLVGLYGEGARSLKILYGGSINESNASDMVRAGDVSGLLVGHVSTDGVRFAALLENLSKQA